MNRRASSVSKTSSRGLDERVHITWENICFETMVRDADKSTLLAPVYKTKKILRDMKGEAESGQLLAILGPTGCGKTSLLNVLAARVPSGGQKLNKLSGQIYMNGQKRNEDKFRKISAYVLQDDMMYAHLTVFETLMLAGHFFLPASLSDAQKQQTVEATIAELGLVKARDTIIGDDNLRGVSGGERKRTAIATQLLTDPAVLFLDEPTSGLDAFQSQAVMECLSSLAASGRLVVTVIHQPRSSIYEMFDKLLVLSEGRAMYYGAATGAVEHFASVGHRCPEVYNPSDYFLDLLSPDNRTPETEEATRNRIQYLGDQWELKINSNKSINSSKGNRSGAASNSSGGNSSAIATSAVDVKQQQDLQPSDDLGEENNDFASIRVIGSGATDFATTWRNFTLLCWRAWSEQSRNRTVIMAKILFNCFFGLIIGGIYSHIGLSQESIQNRKGVLYFVMINQNFGSVTSVLNTFPKEKIIVNRERSGRAYNTFSYFCAKVMMETPLNLLPVLIYDIILYQLVGLHAGRLGYFILITLYTNFTSLVLGLAISAMSADVEAATALGVPMLILFILFGGFYISINSLPIVANWVPYITIFRWSYQAMCINEFKGLEFTCDSPNPAQCIQNGDQVLARLDFQDHTMSYPIFGLSMVLIGLLCIAFLLLEYSNILYTPLGYVGGGYTKYAQAAANRQLPDTTSTTSSSSPPVAAIKTTSIVSEEAGYEMVPTGGFNADEQDRREYAQSSTAGAGVAP